MSEMKHYRLVALSIPFPGREQELERWYDHQHLPDCLKLEGFIAAQRFRIEHAPMGAVGVPAWKVMAIYEIESADIDTTLAQIPKVARTAAMPMTDALNLGSAIRLVAVESGPRLVAQAATTPP